MSIESATFSPQAQATDYGSLTDYLVNARYINVYEHKGTGEHFFGAPMPKRMPPATHPKSLHNIRHVYTLRVIPRARMS